MRLNRVVTGDVLLTLDILASTCDTGYGAAARTNKLLVSIQGSEEKPRSYITIIAKCVI